MALKIVTKVLEEVKALEQFPDEWEKLKPILVNRKEEPNIRLYLNAYSACGLVLARLGNTEEAQEIAARIKEIDDKKEFGGAIVFDILTNPPDEEDDD